MNFRKRVNSFSHNPFPNTMFQQEITFKEWQKTEAILRLHEHYRWRYWLYALWLIIQSLIALILLAALLVFLIDCEAWGLISICGFFSLLSWVISIHNVPWAGTMKLPRKSFQRFYRRINFISRKVGGPKIHRIYVSGDDCNCAVTSKFVFLPGLKQNILIIGWPLLCGMSSKGFLGTLGHEFGHFSAQHDVILWWLRLPLLAWNSLNLGLFNILFFLWRNHWCGAYNRLLLPFLRRHEIEADRTIVREFGKDYAGATLIELALLNERYSKFEEPMAFKLLSGGAEPADIAALIRDEMVRPFYPEDGREILQQTLRGVTPFWDEHPSFKERLELAGIRGIDSSIQFISFSPNALERLVDDKDEFLTRLSENFTLHFDQKTLADSRREYQETVKRLKSSSLDPRQDIDKAVQVLNDLVSVGRRSEAATLLRDLYTQHSEITEIACRYGCLLIEEDSQNAEAAAMVLRSLKKCPQLITFAHDALFKYYLDSGDAEGLKEFLKLRDEILPGLEEQINSIELKTTDDLRVSVLSEVELEQLRQALRKLPVDRAYAIEKPPGQDMISRERIIVLDKESFSFRMTGDLDEDALTNLYETFGCHFMIMPSKFCRKLFDSLPESEIYRKK